MLVPQADGYSRESVHEFLTQVAQENLLQSWRETMLMVHKQPTKLPTQRPVTSVSTYRRRCCLYCMFIDCYIIEPRNLATMLKKYSAHLKLAVHTCRSLKRVASSPRLLPSSCFQHGTMGIGHAVNGNFFLFLIGICAPVS